MKIYEVQAYTTHISENNGEFVSADLLSFKGFVKIVILYKKLHYVVS
jgi:hypothetical protein